MPAINPQNAAPIPNKDNPDAETKIVMIAASLCGSLSNATLMLDPMVLNSASPAMDKISSEGKAKNMATTVAPKIAIVSQHKPAKIDAL